METKKQKQNPLVNVKALSMLFKVRGSFFKALDEIDFTVNEGDFFGVIGESGSGKSTTGKCLIRLNIPSGGKVEIANHLISGKKLTRENDHWLKQNVQMVFQDPYSSLNPTKNVLTVISEPLVITKTVYGEVKEYLKTLAKLSFKTKKELLREDFELETQFYEKFFSKVLFHLETTINKFALLQESNNNSSAELAQTILGHTDDLIEALRQEFGLVYEFSSSQSEPLQKALKDKQETLAQDTIDKLKQELYTTQQKAKVSTQAFATWQKLQQTKQNLKAYRAQMAEELQNKPRIYLNAWLLTTKNYIKDSRQNTQLTDDVFAFSYNDMVDKKRRLVLVLSEYYKALPYFYDNWIHQNADRFDELTNAVFFDLIDVVIALNRDFANVESDAKAELIRFVQFIRRLCDLRFAALKKSFKKQTNYSFDFNRETELLYANSCYDIKELPQVIQPYWEKLFSDANYDKIAKSVQELNDIISTDIEKASNIASEINTKISSFKTEIAELKATFKTEKKAEDHSAQITGLKTQIAEIQTQIKQQKREVQSTEKAALKPVLKQYKSALHLYKRFKQLLRQFTKQLNLLVKKQQELEKIEEGLDLTIWERIQLLFHPVEGDLKSELKTRLKSFGVINFEYKRAVRESRVFRLVHFGHDVMKWGLFLPLTKIFMRNKVYEALDSVGLKREHAYRYPHEFSGGQRQRIAIARALITKPKLIIADELISALDVSIQAQVINILKDLAKKHNLTVLFIAHDLSMVQTVCNRLIIMHRGKIVERGSTDEIFAHPVHPYTRSLIKASPKLSKINIDLASFDEKFTYDSDYSLTNMPSFLKVPNTQEHELYCTKGQFDSWIKGASRIN